MSDACYPFVLAGIFVLHNVEEYISFDRMPKSLFGQNWMHLNSFLFSILVLSSVLLVAAFCKNEILNIIILFSLMLNALQHCVLSIWYRKMTAGTFSAMFLMLPFSILYLLHLFESGAINFYSFIVYLLVSPVVMVGSILATLGVGNYFFKQRR
jgi:Protein of unknown function with HXXEE motif